MAWARTAWTHGAPRLAHWRDDEAGGLEDLALERSKPVDVSYSVSPCADEALVVVMPAGGDDLLISATVPNFLMPRLLVRFPVGSRTVRAFRVYTHSDS